MDTSISSISLLSRDITPSYALQNNLLKDTWIDITFSGDIPTIITNEREMLSTGSDLPV